MNLCVLFSFLTVVASFFICFDFFLFVNCICCCHNCMSVNYFGCNCEFHTVVTGYLSICDCIIYCSRQKPTGGWCLSERDSSPSLDVCCS